MIDKLSGLFAGEQSVEVEGVATMIDGKLPQQYLSVGLLSVEGDAQADPKHHGGIERVLHHFPQEHYEQYRLWNMMPESKDAPAMGENISTLGLDETQVNIGDIVAIGEVVLQVTQPRSPCFKLNHQFGHPEFALTMQNSGLCGWFYRVLTPGTINLDDGIKLLERKTDMSVRETMNIFFSPEFDDEGYQRLASCEGLAKAWVDCLLQRLASKRVESWERRLFGAVAL